MCPVLELSKYIVMKCIKDNHPISNLQLQKILYYIQREFLQKLGMLAFSESIEAWPFGRQEDRQGKHLLQGHRITA